MLHSLYNASPYDQIIEYSGKNTLKLLYTIDNLTTLQHIISSYLNIHYLELLLDDLQSTLPRKNHGLSNTSSTGYREVTKSTSRTVGDGQTETNKEYEIQYLNPANKSSVLSERLPDLQSVDLLVCIL